MLKIQILTPASGLIARLADFGPDLGPILICDFCKVSTRDLRSGFQEAPLPAETFFVEHAQASKMVGSAPSRGISGFFSRRPTSRIFA